MSNDLIKTTDLVPEKVFIPNGLDFILKEIKSEVSTLVPDISTDKGRKEITSLCYKIKRSKTYLDNLGKDYVAELKARPKIVDAERKRVRDFLDNLEEETRQPLTEWEQAEQQRVNNILARINDIDPFQGGIRSITIDDYSSEEFYELLKKAQDFVIDDSLDEYKGTAIHRKDEVILKLEGLIAKQNKHLEEQAELERLRKEAEERAIKEREERLQQEAAEKARLEAEAKAKAEQERIEREKQAAIAAQKAAEERAKQAEENAKREAELAAQRERDRIAAEQKAEQEAAAKREANKKHRASINNKAVDAIVLAMSEADTGNASNAKDVAKVIVTAIAKGDIPNVSINY